VRSYEEVLDTAGCLDEAERPRLREAGSEVELDYLHHEIPGAVRHLLGGIQRVCPLVEALRILSHPGHDGHEPADLDEMLDAALTLTRHGIDDVAELHLDLGELPPVRCDVAGLTEVLLAQILNAIESIENVGRRGTVRISPHQAGCDAVVAIAYDADEVSDGTPQARHALSVVRAIVGEGHGGTVISDAGQHVGSRISVRLPISGRGRR